MNHLPWLLGALRRGSDGEIQTLESISSQQFDWESNSCLLLLIATRLHAYTKVQWTFRVRVSYVAFSGIPAMSVSAILFMNQKVSAVLETSNREGTVPLESILCTEELLSRASRPPDHEKENRALAALASALSDSSKSILQTLTEAIMEVTRAHSAGVSLL